MLSLIPNTPGTPFELQDLFKLTINVAAEFLFGDDLSQLDGKMFDTEFNIAQEYVALRFLCRSLAWMVLSPRYSQAVRYCRQFVEQCVSRALDGTLEARHQDSAGQYVFLAQLARETHNPIILRDQSLNVLWLGAIRQPVFSHGCFTLSQEVCESGQSCALLFSRTLAAARTATPCRHL
jgi:hypothetical protein